LDRTFWILREYEIIGLAIAFVVGLAVKDLVSATVDALIMPIVGVFLPEGSWQQSTLTLLNIEFQIGVFLSAFNDFLIIALLVFLFVKYILKKEKVEKV
jgi:large conductance mechanosensitive channel